MTSNPSSSTPTPLFGKEDTDDTVFNKIVEAKPTELLLDNNQNITPNLFTKHLNIREKTKEFRSGLTNLGLSHTKITFRELTPFLTNCSRLSQLSLSECRIDDALLMQIGLECNDLTFLDISNTAVSDKGVSVLFIGLGKALQWLDLGNCQNITGECFRQAPALAPLKALNLNDCTKLDTWKFACSLNKFTNLTKLKVARVCDDNLLVMMSMHCPNLKEVQISGSSVTESRIALLLQKCPQIVNLDIQRLRITDFTGECLLYATQLKRLFASYIPQSAPKIIQHVKHLRGVLVVLHIENTGFHHHQQLIQTLPGLKKLNIKENPITEEHLIALVTEMTHLVTIWAPTVSKKSEQELKDLSPNKCQVIIK